MLGFIIYCISSNKLRALNKCCLIISAAPKDAALVRNLTIILAQLNQNANGAWIQTAKKKKKKNLTRISAIFKTTYHNGSYLLLFGKRNYKVLNFR